MISHEELTAYEKDIKKELRDLGGICEIFPDLKANCQEQIDTVKHILRREKAIDENKSARFGKGAKLKKEAAGEIEELEKKLSELKEKHAELAEVIKEQPTIAPDRRLELAALVDEFKTDEINALPFEELAFCFSAGIDKLARLSGAEQKNDILIEKYNRQQKAMHKVFLDALRAEEELFIAFSPATRSPYLNFSEQNGQAALWIFTKEGYAKNCRFFFARQYIFFDIVKFSKKDFAEFSKNLPRCGFNCFTLNNGVHNLTIELSAIAGNVQYSCPTNPALHLRRFDFFQALLTFNKVPQTNHKLYEQYHNPTLMRAKESVMLHELYKAKYTVVMKSITQKDESGKDVESTEIPTCEKDGKRYLLIFTDMIEFNTWKVQSGFKTEGDGFAARVVDFTVINKMAEDTKSELLLDPATWSFEFTKDRRAMAAAIAEQVKKLEEEHKKKQNDSKK